MAITLNMPVEKKPDPFVEWIAVSDKNSEVLMSSTDRFQVVKFVNKVRKAGGEVTVFRSTKL